MYARSKSPISKVMRFRHRITESNNNAAKSRDKYACDVKVARDYHYRIRVDNNFAYHRTIVCVSGEICTDIRAAVINTSPRIGTPTGRSSLNRN